MASGITFSGVGSGIDFDTIRDAILSQRSVPITRLQTKIGNYTSRVDAFKQLNASLAGLTTAAEALTNRDIGAGRSTSATDSGIAASSATSAASVGSYDLNVTRLAANLTQSSRSFSATDAPILANGATTATFELRKGGADSGTIITIDETNNTLAGLRDAINAANAGVKASIIDVKGDGTGRQLVLSSNETGASGRVELVETTSTGTFSDLNLQTLNPPDGDFSKLDALFTLNNLTLSRPTNSISDALTGVAITLKKTGATTISVTASNEIESKLRAFVSAYNAVQDFVGAQYQKDAKDRPTGILAGDSTLRAVQQQLRDTINSASENNGGSLTNLSQIGITAGADGRLTFDATVLSERLKTNADDVKSLLFGKPANDSGLFQNAKSILSGLSDNVSGTVQTTINGYQNSITNMNDSITNRLVAISRLRESLTRQFAAADAAIGQLNGQGTALTSIIKSLQSNKDN